MGLLVTFCEYQSAFLAAQFEAHSCKLLCKQANAHAAMVQARGVSVA